MHSLSKYNYFVNHKNRVICFNGLYGNNFSVSKKEYEFVNKMLKDLITFEILYPSVFLKFKEWGFIIPEDIDELEIIRFRNKNNVFLDRDYHLVINPTLECNFDCWYCYEEHPKGFMSAETIEKVKKHIKQKVDRREITGINLSWFGGEPLLYFDEVIYPISAYAKQIMVENNLSYYCGITTNGYCIDNIDIGKIKEIELNSFQITIDGDETRHNKIRNVNGSPSYKKIMNGINLLCEKNPETNITLRLNYDNTTLKGRDLIKVYEGVKSEFRNRIKPDFQRVWQTYNSKNAGTENKERIELYNKLKKLGYTTSFGTGDFSINRGYTCYVDRFYHTELNYDGKAYKCTARDYGDDYAVGELLDDGTLEYYNNGNKITKMFSKACFENDLCIDCKHLPICNGPCSQKIIENGKDDASNICPLKDCEVSIETFIIEIYNKKMKEIEESNIVL